MKLVERFAENPLIRPEAVKPSRPDLEVTRVFNCGATLYKGRTHLLMRVAERPIPEKGYMSTAFLDPRRPGEYTTLRVRLDDPALDLADPRGVFFYKGIPYLYVVSHLRLATSDDGHRFKVEDRPAMLPEFDYEVYGVEDPRIVCLDGVYYINYSAIAPNGVTTALARTTDFKRYEKLGIIFAPDNKDIAIFPEKVGGRYMCFHRTSMKQIGAPSMWLASSDNLLDWGQHHFVMGPRAGKWDSERVGCGAHPIKTKRGWLEIHHGANQDIRYCCGAMLTDLERPWIVLARDEEPVLAPSAPYEMEGFLPNVIFHNGLVQRPDGSVDLYYGGADTTVCGARMNPDAVLASLTPVKN